MNPSPVIVIAGSRALPKGIAPRLLVQFLAAIPERSMILLRGGVSRTGEFEEQVERVCTLLGLKVEYRRPVAGPEPLFDRDGNLIEVSFTRGRRQTFIRDLEMIYNADLVLCFHTPEQIGDEASGTAALVEKALQAEKIVYAYAIDGEDIARVGEHDPENVWGDIVPQA